MRAIPAGLQAALDSGTSTTCLCWKVIRRDGAVFGFTDHDRDIALPDVTCRAATGLDAGEAEQAEGLSAPASAIAGALASEAITENDIAAGRWDNASVETWLVDWSQPAGRVLLDIGRIGEVARAGNAFRAELRGVAAGWDVERGRRYTALCDAELGDGRCNAALAVPGRQADLAIVSATGGALFRVWTPGGTAAGAFENGLIEFTGGANAGRSAPVRSHGRNDDGTDTISLWTELPALPAAGDPVRITVGCDKTFATCRDTFNNVPNFRGFPHIPGNDHVISYARRGDARQDGGPVRP